MKDLTSERTLPTVSTRRRLSSLAARDGAAEWPVERMIRANTSALTLLGLTLGVFVSRKFLILPVAVALTHVQESLLPRVLNQIVPRRNRRRR